MVCLKVVGVGGEVWWVVGRWGLGGVVGRATADCSRTDGN